MKKTQIFQLFMIVLTIFLLVISSVSSYKRWVLFDYLYVYLYLIYIPILFVVIFIGILISSIVINKRLSNQLDEIKLVNWYLPGVFSLYFILTSIYMYIESFELILYVILLFIVMIVISYQFYRIRNKPKKLCNRAMRIVSSVIFSGIIYLLFYVLTFIESLY